MPYCIECGKPVDESWNACPNCGKNLKVQEVPQPQLVVERQVRTQPQTYQSSSYQKKSLREGQNTFGAIALVCGLVGLFCGGVIFGIIAIIMGGLGLNRDEDTNMAIIGLILGIIDFVCFFITWFWIFSWFTFPFPY